MNEQNHNNCKHHVCVWWMAYFFDNPLRRFWHKPEIMFKDYINEGDTVLDTGCGMGYFSIGMAKMVGDTGKIISVDIQDKMLNVLKKRAKKKGLAGRIILHKSNPNTTGVNKKIDFALLFWMLHEVPDKKMYLQQIYDILEAEKYIFIAEPVPRVGANEFEGFINIAKEIGFKEISRPDTAKSITVVLKKG